MNNRNFENGSGVAALYGLPNVEAGQRLKSNVSVNQAKLETNTESLSTDRRKLMKAWSRIGDATVAAKDNFAQMVEAAKDWAKSNGFFVPQNHSRTFDSMGSVGDRYGLPRVINAIDHFDADQSAINTDVTRIAPIQEPEGGWGDTMAKKYNLKPLRAITNEAKAMNTFVIEPKLFEMGKQQVANTELTPVIDTDVTRRSVNNFEPVNGTSADYWRVHYAKSNINTTNGKLGNIVFPREHSQQDRILSA